jgi:hypothetical protein
LVLEQKWRVERLQIGIRIRVRVPRIRIQERGREPFGEEEEVVEEIWVEEEEKEHGDNPALFHKWVCKS